MFRWADYLALAEQLVQQAQSGGLTDACLRSAISRAYYAALLTARNWIRDCEGKDPPDDSKIHQFVPDSLTEAGVEEAARVAPALSRLRRHRGVADYQDSVKDLRKLAQLSVLEAGDVVRTVERLTQS